MKKVKILWTGGWDSTYRVCDLIINNNDVEIQPYYIKDERRKSTNIELKTIDTIKVMLSKIKPCSRDRIKDTITINRLDIPSNKVLSLKYKTLSDRSHLGDQYDWLARYSESSNISNLELCIHADDKAYEFIKNDIEKTDTLGQFKINIQPNDENLKLFSYFNFPVLKMTKLDMEERAQRDGFSEIMNKTWFCHYPIFSKPCGMCNPCKYTREEGIGRRVPNVTVKLKLIRKIEMIRDRINNKYVN